MNRIPVRLGPLALLLAVISICLTTLAILTFTTARADLRLAEKYAETVKTRYELEKEGQALRRTAAESGPAALPGERGEDGETHIVLEKDGTLLRIAFAPDGGVTEWRHEKTWDQDTDIGRLWPGT